MTRTNRQRPRIITCKWLCWVLLLAIVTVVEAQQKFTEISLPHADSGPTTVAIGSDGTVWFTEQAGNRIGRMAPDGTIREFDLPHHGSSPRIITIGPDNNFW